MGQIVWDQLLGGLRALYQWLIDLLLGTGKSLLVSALESFSGAIPAEASVAVDFLIPYVGAANYWAPVDLALLLLTSYLGIRAGVLVARHIIKAIPTVG